MLSCLCAPGYCWSDHDSNSGRLCALRRRTQGKLRATQAGRAALYPAFVFLVTVGLIMTATGTAWCSRKPRGLAAGPDSLRKLCLRSGVCCAYTLGSLLHLAGQCDLPLPSVQRGASPGSAAHCRPSEASSAPRGLISLELGPLAG